jgi:alkaline phosphatase
VAIDFAEKDKETLVIITTDHGNANPGVIYGKDANANFDSIQKYTHTNEWLLNNIHADSSVSRFGISSRRLTAIRLLKKMQKPS